MSAKMSDALVKGIVVALIVLFAVFLDQFTKFWADDNLSSPRFPEHTVSLSVETPEPVSLQDFIKAQYPKSPDVEQLRMASSATKNGDRLLPQDVLQPGDSIELGYVQMTVIEGYFDFQYARNPGAAWSILANQPAQFRAVFFGITGILAIILIGIFIVRSPWKNQKLLIITLACILGGALGNIIDRFRLTYVIDFISWHVGEHYWPTFNIADVFVTGGVALLVIDLFLHAPKSEKKSKLPQNPEAKSEAEVKSEAEAKSEAEVKSE